MVVWVTSDWEGKLRPDQRLRNTSKFRTERSTANMFSTPSKFALIRRIW